MAIIQTKHGKDGKCVKAWEVMPDGKLRQFFPDDNEARLRKLEAVVLLLGLEDLNEAYRFGSLIKKLLKSGCGEEALKQ